MSNRTYKCVLIGDGAVGKTSLIYQFTQNVFPDEYIPTVFDNCQSKVELDGETYELGIWDTAGQDEYDRIRPVSYTNTSVFIVCYSVVFPISFNNIKVKWVPEIEHTAGPNRSIILLGMKEDLRNDQKVLDQLAAEGNKPISEQQANELLKQIKGKKAMVCSSKENINVTEVFQEVIKISLQPTKKKSCGFK